VQWGDKQVTLHPTDVLPLVGGVLLALLWRAPLLSAWSVLVGVVAAVVLRASRPGVTAHRRAEQELFLTALRSRYGVAQSLAAALEGAAGDLDAPDSQLALAVCESVRRLRVGEPVDGALAPLTAQGQTLRRLTTVLTKAPWSAAAETQALLAELEAGARAQRRLADRARVTLAVVRMTLWILVAANVTAALLGAAIPAWHRHYVAHPGTYVAGTGMALGGFAYFAFKIKALEERL
jgi:hypothetical protein